MTEYAAALMAELLDSSEDQTATLLHLADQLSTAEVRRLRAVLDGRQPPRRRATRS